jgi:hypothetical protein
MQVRRPRRRERLLAAAYDLMSTGVERAVFGVRRRELSREEGGQVLDMVPAPEPTRPISRGQLGMWRT